jgi:hypothetical protein
VVVKKNGEVIVVTSSKYISETDRYIVNQKPWSGVAEVLFPSHKDGIGFRTDDYIGDLEKLKELGEPITALKCSGNYIMYAEHGRGFRWETSVTNNYIIFKATKEQIFSWITSE